MMFGYGKGHFESWSLIAAGHGGQPGAERQLEFPGFHRHDRTAPAMVPGRRLRYANSTSEACPLITRSSLAPIVLAAAASLLVGCSVTAPIQPASTSKSGFDGAIAPLKRLRGRSVAVRSTKPVTHLVAQAILGSGEQPRAMA